MEPSSPPSSAQPFQLFERLPELYLVFRPDAPHFTILAASDAYLAATHTRRQDIVGRGVFEVFPENPADEPRSREADVRASYARAIASKRPHQMPLLKYDVPNKNGYVEKYWRPINTPILDVRGEVEYVVHRVEDVTAEVLLERREAESRAMIEAMLESMPAGVVAVDMQGAFLVHNAEAHRLTHTTPAELPSDVHAWPVLSRLADLQGKALPIDEAPLCAALKGEAMDRELMVRSRGPGKSRLVDANARPLQDRNGRQRGAIVLITDIEQRKQQEQALQARETRYRHLAEKSPVLLWSAPASGKPDHFNRTAAEYFDVGVEALIERGWLSLVHADERSCVERSWFQAVDQGQAFHETARLRRRDGAYRWHDCRAVRTSDAEGHVRWTGVLIDVHDALARLHKAVVPQPDAQEASPDFDARAFDEFCDNFGMEGAREIVFAMTEEMPRQLLEFSVSVARDDLVSARRVIHTLKANSLLLGARSLAALCERDELALRDLGAEAVTPDVQGIRDRYEILIDRCRAALRGKAVA